MEGLWQELLRIRIGWIVYGMIGGVMALIVFITKAVTNNKRKERKELEKFIQKLVVLERKLYGLPTKQAMNGLFSRLASLEATLKTQSQNLDIIQKGILNLSLEKRG